MAKLKSSVVAALAAIVLVFVGCDADPAHAAVRLFDFTARVDQPGSYAPVDTLVTGQFGYDDGVAPFFAGSYDVGAIALYADPMFFITASFGGVSYVGAFGLAQIIDNGGTDGDGFGLTVFADTYLLQISIGDPAAAAFSGIGLPSAFPSLAQGPFADPNDDDDLDGPSGTFAFADIFGNTFDATLLSATPAAVPEPSSWVMILLGSGLVGASVRRRPAKPRAMIA